MPSAFIITNGGLDPISVNNYASIFSTEEEAIRYAALMRINIKHNFYMIDIPEPERPINVLITHYYPSKKKTVLYVSSQEEAHVIASSYYKQQYDEYLATQEKTKRKNLHGFQPILGVKRNARKMKSELLPRDAKSCG